ncbi:hypothetical protein HK1_01940 [Tepidibacillus sp. HK-1]|nr:hypothetical protein HK1_01940 [Tepidibacillus sp. HK-1]
MTLIGFYSFSAFLHHFPKNSTEIIVVWQAGENIGKEWDLGKDLRVKKSEKKAEEKQEWIPEFRSARNMTF